MKININFRANGKSKIIFKRRLIFTLVIIWLFSALLITKDFTGLLLNTFFKIKFKPIVNSLDDIFNKKDILIDANKFDIMSLNDSYGIETKKIHGLLRRVEQYQAKSQEISMKDRHIDLIMGKLILLVNSIQIEHYLELNKEDENLLFNLDEKYLPDFANLLIKKDQFLSKHIHNL